MSTREGRALYVQDVEGSAPPRRVGVVPPRFRRPVFSPDGKAVYFTSDDHGDEVFRMLRVDLASGAIAGVATADARRRGQPYFTRSGDRFLGDARKMSETGAALYEQALTDGATPAPVYADRERVATDDGTEKTYLIALDARSGRELARYTEARASGGAVQGLVTSATTIAYVIMGGSAGGYYTLMCLAHHPELWRAGVAFVPLYDLKLAVSSMEPGLRRFLEERELVPLTEPATLAALSPSTYVDRIQAPLFVYAGARDVRTPTEQIDELVRDLRARHGTVEYMRSDMGHSRGDPKVDAQRLARVLRFLGDAMR